MLSGTNEIERTCGVLHDTIEDVDENARLYFDLSTPGKYFDLKNPYPPAFQDTDPGSMH